MMALQESDGPSSVKEKVQDSTDQESVPVLTDNVERFLKTSHDSSRSPSPEANPTIPNTNTPTTINHSTEEESKKRKRQDSPTDDKASHENLDHGKEEGAIDDDSDDGRKDDSRDPPSKRARTVSTPTGDNDEQTRRRGARVFGRLLGTLNQAKKTSLLRAEQQKKRDEIQKTVRTKIVKENEEIARSIEKDRARKRERKVIAAKILSKKRERDLQVFKIKQQQNCLHLLRTKTQPTIYYLPKVLTGPMKTTIQEQKEQFAAYQTEAEDKIAALSKEIEELEKSMPEDFEEDHGIKSEPTSATSENPLSPVSAKTEETISKPEDSENTVTNPNIQRMQDETETHSPSEKLSPRPTSTNLKEESPPSPEQSQNVPTPGKVNDTATPQNQESESRANETAASPVTSSAKTSSEGSLKTEDNKRSLSPKK